MTASQGGGAAQVAVVATDASVEHAAATARALAADTRQVVLVGSARAEASSPDGVSFVERAPLDVEVTPAYLTESYGLYRTLRDIECRTVVFPDRGAAGYCTARAKETGAAFGSTAIVVDCVAPTARSAAGERRPFLSRRTLGVAIAERLTLELADAFVCTDEDVARWLEQAGWALPARLGSARDACAAETSSVQSASADQALVSVVVSHRERPAYLRQCLDGLVRQTYTPLEVVVADDGSASPEAVRGLEELEARTWPWPLRVLRLAAGGAASARNGGWRAASGDFVVFVDDDDVPFDKLLEALWKARAHSGADVVVAGARWFHGDGAPTAHSGDVVRVSLCRPFELGLISNQYGGPTNLWPRDLLERLGGFPPVPLEDWNLLARAALSGARLTTPPDPLYWYRQTAESAYTADTLGARDAALPALADVFAEQLPAELRLLPRLAAGAYSELDRRKDEARSRSSTLVDRGRLVARRAREVRAEEGLGAIVRRAARFGRRTIGR